MLPSPKKSKIQSRKLAGDKSELERSYYGLSRLVSRNKTESQSALATIKSTNEKAVEVTGSNKELLERSLTQQNNSNKILQEIIRTLKERNDDGLDIPNPNRNRGSRGRGSRGGRTTATGGRAIPSTGARARVEPTLNRTPPPSEPVRTQAPRPTATQQPAPRPGRIAVGGGLEYDVGTNRYHDPNLPGNRNMVSRTDAIGRGAAPPTAEQIEEARRARTASRAAPPPTPTPTPAPPPPELRANPSERLAPTPTAPAATPAAPGVVQRADQALGRALNSGRGRVAVGGLTFLAAVPLIYEAYNNISSLPTDMPRSEYEQRVTTIIAQLLAAGIALPYIGAVIGGLIGSALLPGIGTIAGLGAGIAGGVAASYTLDSAVRELVSKIVDHFYDQAARRRSEEEHIRYFNEYRAMQRSLPQEQRNQLPDNIDDLQRLLAAATVVAQGRGGRRLMSEASALVTRINRKIVDLRDAEQRRTQQPQEEDVVPDETSSAQDASVIPARNEIEQLDGGAKSNTLEAFTAIDRSEYRNLTFEASTIVFEGDMEQQAAMGIAPPSMFSGASSAAAPAAISASMPATRITPPPAASGEGGSAPAPQQEGGSGGAPGPMASSGTPTAPSRFVPGRNEQTNESFMAELNAVANRLGVQPNDLLAVMRSETGGTLNPSIPNAAGSGAVGLIQFMPNTARGLGTTTAELSRMSATEQLRYVEAYFRQNRLPRGASAAMIYAYTFMPGAARTNPNQLAVRGTSYYAANQGLDINDDGIITIDDLDRFLRGERRGRGAAGQRVSAAPQTGAEMAGSTTAIEAERQRRMRSSSVVSGQQTSRAQIRDQNSQLAMADGQNADAPLRVRLVQAIG